MPYDPTAPDSNLTLQASDDILRADKTFLKNGLEREHHFDGVETSGSGDHLVHKMGSARVFIFTGTPALTTGTLSSTYSLSKARNTGLVVIDKQAGRAWWCWDGAADGWIELSKLGGALEVVGALTVGGALTVAGLSTLSGDVQMATTKKLKVIAGESFIQDSGAVQLNPYLHAARHKMAGGNGTWASALDPLRGLIQDIAFNSLVSSVALTGSYVNRVQITRNLASRTGATSRVLAIGIHNSQSPGANATCHLDVRITRDSGTAGSIACVANDGVSEYFTVLGSSFIFELFESLTAASHTFEIQSRSTGGVVPTHNSSYLLLLDLGDAT